MLPSRDMNVSESLPSVTFRPNLKVWLKLQSGLKCRRQACHYLRVDGAAQESPAPHQAPAAVVTASRTANQIDDATRTDTLEHRFPAPPEGACLHEPSMRGP